jgi:hypothetical protein
MADLKYDCLHLQKQGEVKTLAAFNESLGKNYYHQDRTAAIWQCQDDFEQWLCESWNGSKKRYITDFQEAIARVNQLVELAKQRIEEINQTLDASEAAKQDIQQAEIVSKGMQQQELFSRYQRNINRELYEALDRLETIQQRRNQGSMGSFGQNSELSHPFQASSVSAE